MTNFTKQFKKLYAGKGTANGGLMLALSPQFLKLDEINEIPIDTDFELKWTCSSKVGLVDVEIYLLNYLVNSYTDIDAQDKSATIKVEEGDAVMVGGTLRIVIKDKLGILEDEIEVEVVEGVIISDFALYTDMSCMASEAVDFITGLESNIGASCSYSAEEAI